MQRVQPGACVTGAADVQTDELLAGVESHLRSIPFFHDLLDGAGVAAGTLDEGALQRLAPTTKEMLRETPWHARCAGTDEGGMILGSSGTTGIPTLYKWTRADLSHVGEVTGRFRRELGVGSGDIGAVWAPIDRSVMGQCMLYEFLVDGIDVSVLGGVAPDIAMGYLRESSATVMKALPRAVMGLSMMPGAQELPLRQVHVGGDLLTSRVRQHIERTLGCGCYNFYGLSEVWGPLAAECSAKSGLHYLNDDVMIEVLNPLTGAPCGDGEVGVACFTTLWAKSSPVLRYWSGDLVERVTGECSCGSPLPRIIHHGRLRGFDYSGSEALSSLTVDSVVDRHTGGLLDFQLQLSDDAASLTVYALDSVDRIMLADELGDLLQRTPNIEVLGPERMQGGPKFDSIIDLRTAVTAG